MDVTENPSQFLKNLPSSPGVYQMYDHRGTLLYVGKARNLKKRVSSYFREKLDSAKTSALMSQVTQVEYTVTDSENQALLLEANLIKQHHPRYNVLLRDDKSYPYLFLSNDPFPRMDFHRGAKKKAGRYFGPFPNAGSVRDNLALLQKLFQVRQCHNTFFKNRSRPCLQYQIKRCTAPCVGTVSEDEYEQQVNNAVLFLEGKNASIVDALSTQMQMAAEKKDYEHAAILRDQLVTLRKLNTQQHITGDEGDIDIIGVATEAGVFAVSVIFVRGGRLLGHKTYFPKVPMHHEVMDVLSEFIPQYYLSPLRGDIAIERIVLPAAITDKAWLQDALREQLGRQLQLSTQARGKFKVWQKLAQKNAEQALSQQLSQQREISERYDNLQKELRLPESIERIECFDISHSHGEATVASCVVFAKEGPNKKAYRHYNIEGVKAGDDYAAMEQVLFRRYKRLKQQNSVLPDLVVIDGGKGQLKQAIRVFEELQISGVLLLGIAKGPTRKAGFEKCWLAGRDHAVDLHSDSPALKLLQWIRDEAHRFAITFHRSRRSKRRQQSLLENIEGIGPKRRQALLAHFGGLQQLKAAGVADIENVPGISAALAKKIYQALR